jgi:hypothetical protein
MIEYSATYIGINQATMIEHGGQMWQVIGPVWLVYEEEARGPKCYNPILFMQYFSPRNASAFRAWHRCVDEVYDDKIGV